MDKSDSMFLSIMITMMALCVFALILCFVPFNYAIIVFGCVIAFYIITYLLLRRMK